MRFTIRLTLVSWTLSLHNTRDQSVGLADLLPTSSEGSRDRQRQHRCKKKKKRDAPSHDSFFSSIRRFFLLENLFELSALRSLTKVVITSALIIAPLNRSCLYQPLTYHDLKHDM